MQTEASRNNHVANNVPPPVMALEHLTGPMRGTTTWITNNDISITLSPSRIVHVVPGAVAATDSALIARLRRSGDSFEIEAVDGRPIWVNGQSVQSIRLKHRDMIEF